MTGEAGKAAKEAPEQYGLFYVDLSRTEFAPGASNLLPEETARRERAVPIERRGDVTVLAISSPPDDETLDTLRSATGGEVVAVIAPASQVLGAINRLYGDAAGRARRRAADDETVPGARTLEDSLREVLAPPDPSDFLPPSPQQATDEPSEGAEGPETQELETSLGTFEPDSGHAPGRNGHARPLDADRTSEAQDPSAGAHARLSEEDEAAPRTADTPPERSRSKSEKSLDPKSAPAPAPVTPPSPGALATNGSHPATTRPGADGAVSEKQPSAPEPVSGSVNGSVAAPEESAPNGAAPTVLPVEEPPLPVEESASDESSATLSITERAIRVDTGSPADASSPGSALAPPGGASPPLPPPGKGSPGGEAGDAQSAQWPALARVLVASGRVPFDDMVRALRDHRSLGESLARYLQRERLVTEEDLVQAMAQEMGLEFVDLTSVAVDPTIAALVPDAVARRHMVLPIRVEDGVPIVAMANPTDVFAMDDLRTIMGRNFTPVVALRSQIDLHLRRLGESDSDVAEAAQHAEGTVSSDGGGFEIENLHSVVEDAPIVRYVNLLILQALNERASDIHIEPTPRRMRIRFRIDGVMHDASSASPAIHAAVISRLKVLGEMDITEHRVPQEGRVSVSVGDRQIDLRLAMLPSLYGETCVMRLLDKTASIRQLSELGFLTDTLERYARSYSQPYGVILVTGPTGAGKTTTLYGTLQQVMNNEKSVVTVEDPVEYQIEGITQVQINSKVGLQFSTALRSILRADPDIILVGEIRDIETATIAMEAALSGHLVLTTLHTNTAASTPLRLTEMGIEPFLVTSAVTGVLTQRLARVLCEKCKSPYEATVADFHAAGFKDADLEGLDTSSLWHANGCRTCSHTGYYGRMILCETMPMTEEIERMIIEQQSIVAMERKAVEQGMRTLRQDGLIKALAGYTTLEEVLRVVI
jgi:type IV pilus assembly protein PilB